MTVAWGAWPQDPDALLQQPPACRHGMAYILPLPSIGQPGREQRLAEKLGRRQSRKNPMRVCHHVLRAVDEGVSVLSASFGKIPDRRGRPSSRRAARRSVVAQRKVTRRKTFTGTLTESEDLQLLRLPANVKDALAASKRATEPRTARCRLT